MARAFETAQPRRFTVDEYHLMAESGILKPDERIELIRGEVRRLSPKNWAHVVAVTKVYRGLVEALAGRAGLYQEAPLMLVRLDSEPEPDILVTSSPEIEDYGKPNSRILLVVEVAESSLLYDLNSKAPLYAEAEVPEYWVLNLVDRELVVFRSPAEGAYRERRTLREGAGVTPEAWPDVRIDVSELLPSENSG